MNGEIDPRTGANASHRPGPSITARPQSSCAWAPRPIASVSKTCSAAERCWAVTIVPCMVYRECPATCFGALALAVALSPAATAYECVI